MMLEQGGILDTHKWNNIFAHHICDSVLVSTVCEELSKHDRKIILIDPGQKTRADISPDN